MSNGLTALASENLNPSLRSLLEDVQRGHIRVPRFQRPFIWTDDQRIELLRSVRDNMPIGSLLVWRTINFKLASFPMIGPHSIPAILDTAPATGWQYLLDGHQRVSTLLGTLLPADDSRTTMGDEDDIDWNIQYDLHEDDFIFATNRLRKRAVRPLLPLSTLLDGRLVNKYMRDLRKLAESQRWTESDLDAWEVRADQLAYRFQQCRIPIVVMVTDDLGLAAKSFQRINSLGTPMDESHLVAALTWTSSFDLRERVVQLREKFCADWAAVDEDLFLQVCKGLLELDVTKSGQPDLVNKLKEDHSLLERAGDGLARAVDMLWRLAAVPSQELLPYALQVVLLAVEFAKDGGDRPTDSQCLAWFWRTSWSEVFATATYRKVKYEQENLRHSPCKEQMWSLRQRLPDRFDIRSARARLFMLRHAARTDLTSATGTPADGRNLLMNHGRYSLVRLFNIPRHASPAVKRLLQGCGNRFFIAPAEAPMLRERLLVGPALPDSALGSHFVDSAALNDLRGGDFEGFLSRRAAAMEEWDYSEWRKMEKIATECLADC